MWTCMCLRWIKQLVIWIRLIRRKDEEEKMKNKCQSAQCENAEGTLDFKEDEDV
jgi:hypothetical protein